MIVAWGPPEIERAAEIIRFSKEHPYHPTEPGPIPGDKEEHVMWIPFGIRVVYSVTVLPDVPPYRHLSLSVPGVPKRLPVPEVVFKIASELFDFAPPAASWDVLPDFGGDLAIVVLAQPLEVAS